MSRITCKRKGVKQYQQMKLLFTVFKDSVRKKGELKLLFFPVCPIFRVCSQVWVLEVYSPEGYPEFKYVDQTRYG